MKTSGEANVSSDIHQVEKMIISGNIPIEELLGSVTTYNNIEGSDCKSQQLRSSARVFKKMKLDSAIAEKKEPPPPPVKEEQKPEPKKQLKPMWSAEDKSLFFEALNEYGKDFDGIQAYMGNKLKKRGLPESAIKSREQIRHLYYRTWHKISKHLKFNPETKKLVQELYGLVNYGELRRKVGSVSPKTCVKLNELMYTGTLALRRKGKTIRIKTPMCRALRKVNLIDDNLQDLKLPSKVSVEIRPKDMNSWMNIQSLAQNPRIKAVVPLQQRLSSLINCIKERWKPPCLAAYEKTLSSVNNVTMDLLPDNNAIETCKMHYSRPLRLTPPAEAKVELPAFNLIEYLTCQSICLNGYEERMGIRTASGQQWHSSFPSTPKAGKGSKKKRQRQESASEKQGPKPQNDGVEAASNSDNHKMEIDPSDSVTDVVKEAVNTILALNNQEKKEDEKVTDCGKPEVKQEVKDYEEEINKIRRGWTVEECGTLCVGELYLMFGADGKIILEYDWDDEVKIKREPGTCLDVQAQVNTSLQRLLSVAKLHYRKNLIKCPCGHVCGGTTTKSTSNCKTKGSAKATKVTEASSTSTEEPKNVDVKPAVKTPNPSPAANNRPRPISPQVVVQRPSISNVNYLRAQLESIQRLRPKFCSRRGRPRSKQVVVERKLPVIANKGDIGQIVQMNIISQDKFEPVPSVMAKIAKQETDPLGMLDNHPKVIVPDIGQGETFITQRVSVMEGLMAPPEAISDNAIMSTSRVSSPTSISNLLDLALGAAAENGRSDNNESGMPSFAGILSDNLPTNTPPVSPSRILREHENQWLNSEVADFSLSSLLGHLESPIKPIQSGSEDSRMSQDVDAQLQSLLTENSIDYTAKFADLAEVVSDTKKV